MAGIVFCRGWRRVAAEPPSIAILAADQDFVRRLARTLLRDDNDADDVAQQAWLDARCVDPRKRHRDAARRAARERAAARPETLPSTVDVLSFEANRRTVVEAVYKAGADVKIENDDGVSAASLGAKIGVNFG